MEMLQFTRRRRYKSVWLKAAFLYGGFASVLEIEVKEDKYSIPFEQNGDLEICYLVSIMACLHARGQLDALVTDKGKDKFCVTLRGGDPSLFVVDLKDEKYLGAEMWESLRECFPESGHLAIAAAFAKKYEIREEKSKYLNVETKGTYVGAIRYSKPQERLLYDFGITSDHFRASEYVMTKELEERWGSGCLAIACRKNHGYAILDVIKEEPTGRSEIILCDPIARYKGRLDKGRLECNGYTNYSFPIGQRSGIYRMDYEFFNENFEDVVIGYTDYQLQMFDLRFGQTLELSSPKMFDCRTYLMFSDPMVPLQESDKDKTTYQLKINGVLRDGGDVYSRGQLWLSTPDCRVLQVSVSDKRAPTQKRRTWSLCGGSHMLKGPSEEPDYYGAKIAIFTKGKVNLNPKWDP